MVSLFPDFSENFKFGKAMLISEIYQESDFIMCTGANNKIFCTFTGMCMHTNNHHVSEKLSQVVKTVLFYLHFK